ncbi:MAG: nitrous oxide reductase family maturation protein NosD [Deltaproteobacteria bacterium]|nr:MAG: nitrous oxide reductase family maturation protein NosD [Deltaproteobacteria bacterium]
MNIFFLLLGICFSNFAYAIDIHHLIEIAKPFDEITIPFGAYKVGTILIDKPLTIKGIGMPILDGQGEKNTVKIEAPDVIIEGFEIIGSGYSEVAEYAGVKIEAGERCEVKNNKFNNNTYSVFLVKSKDCRIFNNIISADAKYEATSGNGVHLWNCKGIIVEDNVIRGHRDGIYIEFTTDSMIKNNLSEQNIRYGLHFMYSHRNKYVRNSFLNNQTGVAVMYSKNIEMLENDFQKSWGRSSYGLLLKDISDSYIGYNSFRGNTMGIVCDAASRNIFIGNSVKDNGWALNILGNSESNFFKNNVFISNFFDAMTNAERTTNVFWGNYWNLYFGYDLNYDGIGDSPYRPMKMFAKWVAKYPELTVLLGSPVVEFLEIAEKVFPILTPITFMDSAPLMRR